MKKLLIALSLVILLTAMEPVLASACNTTDSDSVSTYDFSPRGDKEETH